MQSKSVIEVEPNPPQTRDKHLIYLQWGQLLTHNDVPPLRYSPEPPPSAFFNALSSCLSSDICCPTCRPRPLRRPWLITPQFWPD